MAIKRNASEQVAYRIEPELSTAWAEFVSDSLIPNRAHHACATLLYLGAAASLRDAVQRLYARFQRSGELQLPSVSAEASADPMSADERDLLVAYRAATEEARDEAIANLLEQPGSVSRKAGTSEKRDHRVG